MTEPREAATKQQYQDSEEAFFQVMEEYQPDILIVWGRRLWSNLPYTGWEDDEEIRVDGFSVDNGYYTLKNGHKVRAFCIYHPSVGYDWAWWHKVISIFIQSEDKATNVIDGVGFSNFRRFRHFPSLHLGGVNIIVGANNAGKSTFDKATMLFLDFIQKWLNGNAVSINFDSNLCRELSLNSYEDAFNYNVDKEKEHLCFNITIGRYYYEAAFCPGDIESKKNTIANAIYVKLIDTKDNNSEYVFDYNKSQNSVSATVTLPLFSPAINGIETIESYLNTPICPLETDVKANIYSNLDVIRDCFEKGCYDDKILEAFKQVDESLGENTPKNYELFKCLRSAIGQVVIESPNIQLEITLPRTATPKDLFEKLKSINEIQPNYDENKRNNPRVIEAKLCPIITLTQKKTFSTYDTDSVSVAVSSFCQKLERNLNEKNGYYYLIDEDSKKDMGKDDITKFLERWLNEKEGDEEGEKKGFKIGKNIRFRGLFNEVYTMDIKTMDDHWTPLTSMGMGSVHLVALLLTIANFRMNIGNLKKQSLVMEEPEINLHPNRQSMLADLLMDIYETFGIQIIVETHSEYLVRRLQVCLAHLIADTPKKLVEINENYKVYYFPETEIPYIMMFQKNGCFEENFGTGFFDESDKSFRELLRKEWGD